MKRCILLLTALVLALLPLNSCAKGQGESSTPDTTDVSPEPSAESETEPIPTAFLLASVEITTSFGKFKAQYSYDDAGQSFAYDGTTWYIGMGRKADRGTDTGKILCIKIGS